MVAQSIARNAMRTLLWVKNVKLVATCALIGFRGMCQALRTADRCPRRQTWMRMVLYLMSTVCCYETIRRYPV